MRIGENMSKCYTFDEWFDICNELNSLYWACLKLCLGEKEEITNCIDECKKKVLKYGIERYGLREDQAWICAHTQ